MAEFNGTSLPPELGEVEERLREHRYEASALELDRLKQQARGRASRSSTSLPSMRQESGMLRRLKGGFLTAMLILGLMIGGTGAMLAVTGVSPFTNGEESQGDDNGLAKNASHSQYADHDDDDGKEEDEDDDGEKDDRPEGAAFVNISRPPGCSPNPFNAFVTGSHIGRVDFFIGNWLVGSAVKPDASGRWVVTVNPRLLRLRRGPHVLTAFVWYGNGAIIPWTREAVGFCR